MEGAADSGAPQPGADGSDLADPEVPEIRAVETDPSNRYMRVSFLSIGPAHLGLEGPKQLIP